MYVAFAATRIGGTETWSLPHRKWPSTGGARRKSYRGRTWIRGLKSAIALTPARCQSRSGTEPHSDRYRRDHRQRPLRQRRRRPRPRALPRRRIPWKANRTRPPAQRPARYHSRSKAHKRWTRRRAQMTGAKRRRLDRVHQKLWALRSRRWRNRSPPFWVTTHHSSVSQYRYQ